MAVKLRTNFFFYTVFSLFFCAYLSHHYLHHHSHHFAAVDHLVDLQPSTASFSLRAIQENIPPQNITPQPAVISAAVDSVSIPVDSVSILLPDWEILVIAPVTSSYSRGGDGSYSCLFPNHESSPARPAGALHFPERVTFKCVLPERSRRRMPFPAPFLTRNPAVAEYPPATARMLRWTFIVYDSFSTEENDVVVLAKGLNNRQGVNREPTEFNCVFYKNDDVANGVRTAVTSSMQEVFRCNRPELTGEDGEIKVTVEIVNGRKALPSVAYYSAAVRTLANSPGRSEKEKALLCACTMVYNVGKFLREWVMYNSNLGVETFMLYDNGSDDDLQNVVAELVREGYDVRTFFWLWPKAQEAGFSHSAMYLKSSCNWTAYIDVDEFIYSPAWSDFDSPSNSMLRELLQESGSGRVNGSGPELGEVSIHCREFGPSNLTEHPPEGVTQGYTCRKSGENRHKSIVRNDAVDDSLLNMIHHFVVKPGFYGKKMSVRSMIVNHYKFQAWPEFKAKFRRRVSAYVVDWTQQVNPNSNDRAPGLGFAAVEPEGWPEKFCQVQDDGLKNLTRKWFAAGEKLAWQR